jgi:hypothetical protein
LIITTIIAKCLKLLHEAVPSVSKTAALIIPANANAQIEFSVNLETAKALNLTIPFSRAEEVIE